VHETSNPIATHSRLFSIRIKDAKKKIPFFRGLEQDQAVSPNAKPPMTQLSNHLKVLRRKQKSSVIDKDEVISCSFVL
jgi:hypothetical protein